MDWPWNQFITKIRRNPTKVRTEYPVLARRRYKHRAYRQVLIEDKVKLAVVRLLMQRRPAMGGEQAEVREFCYHVLIQQNVLWL